MDGLLQGADSKAVQEVLNNSANALPAGLSFENLKNLVTQMSVDGAQQKT